MVKIPKRKNQKVATLGIGTDEVVVAKLLQRARLIIL